jgi:hypothetical protein
MESIETPPQLQRQQANSIQYESKQYAVIALGAILILFIIFLVFLATKREKTTIQSKANGEQTEMITRVSKPVSSPTPMIYDVTMELTKKDGLITHRFGQELVIILTADSKGRDVTGYDALVGFDTSKVQLKSVKSLVSDMTIYKYEKDNMVQITGTKSLSSTSLVFFNRTPILEYTFQPIQQGTAIFEIIDVKGKAKSQIVDSRSVPVLVTPSKFEITIQ